MAQLAAIFAGVGAVYGLLNGDGLMFGALAGLLLFGFMASIGLIAELFR